MTLELDARQKDALGEAGHIGAGSAATALEQMLGEAYALSPPRMGGGAEPLGPIEVALPLTGTCEGELRVIFSAPAADWVLQEMNGEEERDLMDLGEEDISSLCEAANILGCAYLTGLGDQSGLPLRPRPPALRFGGYPREAGDGLWIASRLRERAGFEIEFVLRLKEPAVLNLLEALHIST